MQSVPNVGVAHLDYSFFVALFVGFLSAFHCFGMCGGIIGALTLGLAPEIRENRLKLLGYVAVYSLGRMSSYAIAGAIAGALSGTVIILAAPEYGHRILQIVASIFLLGIGFFLAGWLPKLAIIENVGRPLWRQLQPLGRRIFPVASLPRALLFGVVWGWLPCGLVYTTLIWAATAGNSTDAAMRMIGFGLGTMPAALVAGSVSSWMVDIAKKRGFRRWVGLSIIVVALVGLAYTVFDWQQHFHEFKITEPHALN